jgi:radical SAM-linked protein
VPALKNVRVKFKKDGRARYISHLDLNRFMIRAIRRAAIPVWYTKGFNTHPYIVFGQPLSLGFSSLCEHMDFKLEGDLSIGEVQDRFSKQMPEGLDIISVKEAVKKISEIEYAEYIITIFFNNISQDVIENKIKEIFERESLVVEKKSKSSIKEVDIKEYLDIKSIEAGDNVLIIDIVLPSNGQININPNLIPAIIKRYSDLRFDSFSVTKTEVFDTQMKNFC